MRFARALVLAGLAFKVVVLGAWWWEVVRPAYAAKGAEGAGAEVPGDLLGRSRGFRDLLEAVRQRGAELDQREQAVAAREAALKTLEKTIADEVARLESLTKTAGGPGAGPTGVGVTKVYESMKADEAGPILDRLDDATATAILSRMKEKQIGAILAAMNKDRAVQLTKLLARPGAGPAPSVKR